MWKKVIFSALFLLSGDSLLSQNIPVPVPGASTQLFNENYPPVFLALNRDIPKKVLKVREESLVAVRVGFSVIRSDQNIYEDAWYGAGFTPWGNYVVTNLHLFGNYPGMWRGTADFPISPQVFDGKNFFTAELTFYDYQADLALLKVKTPNESGQHFSQKPVKLMKIDMQDQDSLESLASQENYFAFGPYVSNPHFYFTIKLGFFRTITNIIDSGYVLPTPMGILQGGVQPGFSGGPLLSSKGEVAGVVTRSSDINTFVIMADTVNNFLITASAHLGLDLRGRPLAFRREKK